MEENIELKIHVDDQELKTVEKKKYKKELIPVALRKAVWNTYIGENFGMGYCFAGCRGIISQMNFACGHVISEKDGGKLILQNLRPVCTTCNSSMSTQNMTEFMKKYGLEQPKKLKNVLYVKSECCTMI